MATAAESKSKLPWRPVRDTRTATAPAVRTAQPEIAQRETAQHETVQYEEDVFADGPVLQKKASLASAPLRVSQSVPKSPFEEEPTPTVPPPAPLAEPQPTPPLEVPPLDTTPAPAPAPQPVPAEPPPPPLEFRPPTTVPQPAPAAEPPLERPRRPEAAPPDIFLPPAQFDREFFQRGRAPANPAQDCEAAYSRLKKNTIDKVNIDIHIAGQPGDDVPFECTLGDTPFDPRCWKLTTYTWKASALCHKPIYFEEEALERYGHSHGPGCEYLVSFAHFFGNVILLPYHMGVETPCECIYDLGVYRPNSCAPYLIDPFPISLRGAAFGAVGYCGTIALFP